MFGIGRLFARRAARKRAIFSFHDGKKTRWLDPLKIEAALTGAGGEDWIRSVDHVHNLCKPMPAVLNDTLKNDLREARRREKGKLLAWIREAFGIEPLGPDGSGMSEVETLAVLMQYLDFCEELANAARPLAESPPSAEPQAT